MKTTFSRRAALLGCVSVTALAGVPAVAVAYETPDAELLHRADKAMRAVAKNDRLWKICRGITEAIEDEPDCPPWPDWPKYKDDYQAGLAVSNARDEYISKRRNDLGSPYDQANAAHKAYGEAALAVFELPAVTLAGVLAKMRLARLAVEDDDYSAFIDGPGTVWLDDAIADLERIGGAA